MFSCSRWWWREHSVTVMSGCGSRMCRAIMARATDGGVGANGARRATPPAGSRSRYAPPAPKNSPNHCTLATPNSDTCPKLVITLAGAAYCMQLDPKKQMECPLACYNY